MALTKKKYRNGQSRGGGFITRISPKRNFEAVTRGYPERQDREKRLEETNLNFKRLHGCFPRALQNG